MKKIEGVMTTALKEHLISGNPITRIEALILFGIPNLTSVISGMKKNGYKIEKQWVSYAGVLRRINEVAVLQPPSNLPYKELRLTEYRWSGA